MDELPKFITASPSTPKNHDGQDTVLQDFWAMMTACFGIA